MSSLPPDLPDLRLAGSAWRGPLDLGRYDRTAALREAEAAAVERSVRWRARGQRAGPPPAEVRTALARLVRPVEDVLAQTGATAAQRSSLTGLVLGHVHRLQRVYWNWTAEEWRALLRDARLSGRRGWSGWRQHLLACAYLLGGYRDLHAHFPGSFRYALACKVFGRAPVDEAVATVRDTLVGWGRGQSQGGPLLPRAVAELLLASGNPRLAGITGEAIARVRAAVLPRRARRHVEAVVRVLEALGLVTAPAQPRAPGAPAVPAVLAVPAAPIDAALSGPLAPTQATEPATSAGEPSAARVVGANRWVRDPAGALPPVAVDVPVEWARWCERWRATSTLSPAGRRTVFYFILQAGRWLAERHPEVTSPAQWSRELAAEYVAAVDRMRVGDWAHLPLNPGLRGRVGQPLQARSKQQHLASLRTFLRDCQEWDWASPRFDVRRAFRTPPAIQALIGPDPRVIADDVWAKLLWAGLTLGDRDVPPHPRTRIHWYPVPMLRALAVTWLFAGLRSDELLRLRVGCVRWQREDVPLTQATPATPGTLTMPTTPAAHGMAATDAAPSTRSTRSTPGDVLPKDAVCWLDVPVTKTSTSFTKAVDRLVGEAIAAWEAARPKQPAAIDAKTGQAVQLLFAFRGQRVGKHYLNRVLIPLLCRKAGVPPEDARGRITSHRARSTIASQLYNAREPLTLFELQEWLGHRSPASTQHYAKLTPTKLARAYEAAGYFQRNLRVVSVLLDRDAITSGAAAVGAPWRFYDLGHGLCTYDFFEQCPHRMACAKCSFYVPKDSTRAQLLEGKANLLRLKQEIPLTNEETAAVDDGLEALERLCSRLADVPTPAGPTPRELGTPHGAPSRQVHVRDGRTAAT